MLASDPQQLPLKLKDVDVAVSFPGSVIDNFFREEKTIVSNTNLGVDSWTLSAYDHRQ